MTHVNFYICLAVERYYVNFPFALPDYCGPVEADGTKAERLASGIDVEVGIATGIVYATGPRIGRIDE